MTTKSNTFRVVVDAGPGYYSSLIRRIMAGRAIEDNVLTCYGFTVEIGILKEACGISALVPRAGGLSLCPFAFSGEVPQCT